MPTIIFRPAHGGLSVFRDGGGEDVRFTLTQRDNAPHVVVDVVLVDEFLFDVRGVSGLRPRPPLIRAVGLYPFQSYQSWWVTRVP